jgi:hypothetical protein
MHDFLRVCFFLYVALSFLVLPGFVLGSYALGC